MSAKKNGGEASAEQCGSTRQPTTLVNLNFSIRDEANLGLFDRWMTEVLEIEIEKLPKLSHLPDDIPQMATAFCWRQMHLYRAMMQLSAMPVFYLGRIRGACRAEGLEDHYRFEVRIASITNISGVSYPKIFQKLAQLSGFMFANEITQDGREKVYNTVVANERVFRGTLTKDATRLPILETAYEMGIPFEHAGRGVYQLGWGSKARMIDGSSTEDDPRLAFLLTKDKMVTSRLMRCAGLPAADSFIVSTPKEAQAAIGRLGWPVVVKPVGMEGGAGITTRIDTPQKLAKAIADAQKSVVRGEPASIMVERQHAGPCHRLFVYNGELMFAVKRSPPSVKGDGKHTVAQLVEQHNKAQTELPRWKRRPAIPLDVELNEVLAANGLLPDSVPKKGAEIHLRYVESMRWGGQGEDVTANVHPANRELARKCAGLMKLRIAGIDMITEDIAVPWYENGAIINEINYKPFFGNFHITRPYVRPFLEDLMGGHDGRIPVMAFIGGEKAIKSALAEQAKAAKKGENWAVTDECRTLLLDGREIYLAAQGLAARGRALTYDATVDGILLVVRDDALLSANLVFDRLDKVIDCRTVRDEAEVGDEVLALLEDLAAG